MSVFSYYYDDYDQRQQSSGQGQQQQEPLEIHRQQQQSFDRTFSGRSLANNFDQQPQHSADARGSETVEHLTFTSESQNGQKRATAEDNASQQRNLDATPRQNRSNVKENPFIIRKDQLPPKEEPSSSTEGQVAGANGGEQQPEYEDYVDANPPTAEAEAEIHRVQNAPFDVPRIPFSSPNDTWITVTNGKPFLPRLRRDIDPTSHSKSKKFLEPHRYIFTFTPIFSEING
jgi:hypothetical protein